MIIYPDKYYELLKPQQPAVGAPQKRPDSSSQSLPKTNQNTGSTNIVVNQNNTQAGDYGLQTDSTEKDSSGASDVSKIPPRAIISEAVVIEEAETDKPLPNFFNTTYSIDLMPKPRITIQDGWILPLLLSAFFFLALIQTLYPKEIWSILKSLVKRGGIRKLEEHDSTPIWRCLLLFLLLFLVISPVFMYQTAGYFGWKTAFLPYLSPYLQLMLIGAGLLGFKILVVAFLGALFLVEQEAVRYVTGIVMMNALLAAILIPVCLGIHLSGAAAAEPFFIAGFALTGLFYSYSVGNGIITGWNNPTLSKFHLFLYFCTLEILPVFIIIKTVKSLI
jgi:hypothetical protein